MAEQGDLRALSDLATPWCLRVVATLRIADHIAAGIDDIAELAAAANCDADALRRTLKHLVSKEVFVETAPGRFALNDVARGLLDESMRLFLDLDAIGGRFAHAWGTLLTYVRTGAPAYEDLFGRPFWDDLDAHPDIGAAFDALMGPRGHGRPDADVLIDGDWISVRTIVDVGGGTGALLAEILRAHPDIEGTLVELPQTAARSREMFEAAGVADRATTVAQSFFDPLPPGADVYVLTGVMNDWPDQQASLILRRCADAARPNGRVVIIGGVSPDDDGNPAMTVETVLLGGRNRTVAEFTELARETGLMVSGTGRQPSGRFVVECRPI